MASAAWRCGRERRFSVKQATTLLELPAGWHQTCGRVQLLLAIMSAVHGCSNVRSATEACAGRADNIQNPLVDEEVGLCIPAVQQAPQQDFGVGKACRRAAGRLTQADAACQH